MLIQALRGITITILILTMSNMMVWAASEMMSSQEIRFSPQDQELTAHFDKVPLHEVLQVLTDQLPVTITIMGFGGHTRLSTTFTNLPLEQGIERLLQGQDYALLYSQAASSQRPQLKEIIVLPRQGSSTNSTSAEAELVMLPTENQQEWSEDQKQSRFNRLEFRNLEPTELADKVETLVQLSDQNQPQSVSLLTKATKDQDPEIRSTASALLEELRSLKSRQPLN